MKKKFIALLSAIAVCAAFAGCEKNNNSSSDAENSSVNNSEASQNSDGETTGENSENNEFLSMFNKKCWFGTNSENTYAVAFLDDKISLTAVENGETSNTEGYWTLNDSELYIFNDEEKTDEAGLYTLTTAMDGETVFIDFNDVVLAPTEDYTYENISSSADSLKSAAEFAGVISDDSVWIQKNENSMYMLNCTPLKAIFSGSETDGSFINSDGIWGIDNKNIYFFGNDNTLSAYYEWGISNDGSEITFNGYGKNIEFTKSENTDIDSIINEISDFSSQTSDIAVSES